MLVINDKERPLDFYETLLIEIDFEEFKRRVLGEEIIQARSRENKNIKYDLFMSIYSELDEHYLSISYHPEEGELSHCNYGYEDLEELDHLMKRVYNGMK